MGAGFVQAVNPDDDLLRLDVTGIQVNRRAFYFRTVEEDPGAAAIWRFGAVPLHIAAVEAERDVGIRRARFVLGAPGRRGVGDRGPVAAVGQIGVVVFEEEERQGRCWLNALSIRSRWRRRPEKPHDGYQSTYEEPHSHTTHCHYPHRIILRARQSVSDRRPLRQIGPSGAGTGYFSGPAGGLTPAPRRSCPRGTCALPLGYDPCERKLAAAPSLWRHEEGRCRR